MKEVEGVNKYLLEVAVLEWRLLAMGHSIFPSLGLFCLSPPSTKPISSCTLKDTYYTTRILSPFFFHFLPVHFISCIQCYPVQLCMHEPCHPHESEMRRWWCNSPAFPFVHCNPSPPDTLSLDGKHTFFYPSPLLSSPPPRYHVLCCH